MRKTKNVSILRVTIRTKTHDDMDNKHVVTLNLVIHYDKFAQYTYKAIF